MKNKILFFIKYVLAALMADVWTDVMAGEEFMVDSIVYAKMDNYPGRVALICVKQEVIEVLDIPSEVKYEGETFTVDSLGYNILYSKMEIEKIEKRLKRVTIPSSIRTSNLPFCDLYGTIDVDIEEVVFAEDCTKIPDNILRGCSGFESVTIPEGVTRIGDYAFAGTNLTSVTIPKNVTYLSGFNETKIESIDIPESVTEIGNYAFERTKLTSVTIPNNVTKIGDYAFGNTNLTNVTIPESVTYLSGFNGTKIESIDIPENVTEIGKDAFAFTKIESIDIPESVTEIGEGAFAFTNLTSLTIPGSVKVINKFNGSYISSYSLLTSVVFQEGVTEIVAEAFYDSQYLTTVTIPESVTKIGTDAFGKCCNISDVYMYSQTPPEIYVPNYSLSSYGPISSCNASDDRFINVYVPEGSEEAYKSDKYWRRYNICTNTNAKEDNDAVSLILDDDELLETEYYNVFGQKLASPAKGINVMKNTYKSGKVTFSKCLFQEP